MASAPSIIAILILLASFSVVGVLAWLVYRFLGWIGLTVACAGGILLITLWVWSDSPKVRVAAVRSEIERIPNIRIIGISDLEEQASESLTAQIEVHGKGQMGFTSLAPQSFKKSPHICIDGIGPFGFCSRTKRDGYQAYSWWIDIGPNSPIPAARALKLTNVQAAISHYDEILSLISDWPVTTHGWPDGWPVKDDEWLTTLKGEIHFSGTEGADYFFCLRRPDVENSTEHK